MRDTELLILERTDSTNAVAKKQAAEGAAHGSAVLAYCQTAGRGRSGKRFASPQGGVYLSVVLRPSRPLPELMHLTPVLAVAACDAIEEVSGVRPRCKWVNDLLLGGKKLAGILVEISGDALVAGIGVNVASVPDEVRELAACLADRGAACDREALARALQAHFINACDTAVSDKAEWMRRYRADCDTIGKTVAAGGATGLAEAVTDDGALVLGTAEGRVFVSAGEAICIL